MPGRKRRQLFVDRHVQGVLVLRSVMYWGFCLLAITLFVLCWRITTGPQQMFYTHMNQMWQLFGPAFVASVLLLPIVVLDSVRLSNRFVGPVLRLRRSMKQLAAGEPVTPLSFRNDDFWQELADDFNAIAGRLETREQREQPEAEECLVGSGAE